MNILQYTFSEDGDILKSENFIPSRNLTIFDTYRVNGTEMEVVRRKPSLKF